MPTSIIKKFPEPVLRKISKPIHAFDLSVEKLAKKLIQVMKAQPGGIGIAAPQIGVLKCMAVVDLSLKDPNLRLMVLINPEILTLESEIVLREGCMSLPDYTANVRRYNAITAKWQDLSGNWITY